MNTASYQTPAMRIRLSLVICVFALLAVGMLVRSTWIQIIHDPKLETLARRQFESKILMKPRRGLILDRTGEPFAINLETSSLAGNPKKNPEIPLHDPSVVARTRNAIHPPQETLGPKEKLHLV